MIEFIKTGNLIPGDKLANTIYNDEFKVLLRKDNRLTTSGIQAIKNLSIKGCYIEHDDGVRREYIPLSQPLLDEDEKIRCIRQIKELFGNRVPFTDPFDSKFKIQRKELEDDIKALVRHLRDLYNTDRLLYETEDYTRTVKNWIYHHTLNTCIISIGISLYLGYAIPVIDEIAIGALYHDYGKAFFGEELYNKPDITYEDKEKLRKHPEIMFRILQRLNYPVNTSYAVWQHHEKLDGEGYPKALKADKLTMPAQIVGLASAFDNLVTMQSYNRDPMNQNDALEYLQGCNDYSIECIRALFEFIVPYPIGARVLLSDYSTGYVLKNTKGVVMRPVVISRGKVYDLANDKRYLNVTIEKVLEN